MTVEVWDHDLTFNDCIGTVSIPFIDLMTTPGKDYIESNMKLIMICRHLGCQQAL